MGLPTKISQNAKHDSFKNEKISSLTDYDICYLSLNAVSMEMPFGPKLMWGVKKQQIYIQEAKKRGMTCGVAVGRKINTKRVSLWKDIEICNAMKIRQRNATSYINDVLKKEANLRNICGFKSTALNNNNIKLEKSIDNRTSFLSFKKSVFLEFNIDRGVIKFKPLLEAKKSQIYKFYENILGSYSSGKHQFSYAIKIANNIKNASNESYNWVNAKVNIENESLIIQDLDFFKNPEFLKEKSYIIFAVSYGPSVYGSMFKWNNSSSKDKLLAQINLKNDYADKTQRNIGTAAKISSNNENKNQSLINEKNKSKALEKHIAELEKKIEELSKPKRKITKINQTSGSGFFITKLGHVITNQHVVKKCNKITVGDNIDRQVPAILLEVDNKNDLALLKLISLDQASSETQSLIKKLRIEIVPIGTAGLMRSNDVELGEDIVVAGFPYGDIFSKDIKVTFGNVNSTKGVGNDSSQFQIQAPVQIGNSGGPIYDKYGNIVGVVVAQLDKLKMAKVIGSLPENVNFGIKASTVKQFLNTSGLPTKWAERDQEMSNKEISKIASKQTVMVICKK